MRLASAIFHPPSKLHARLSVYASLGLSIRGEMFAQNWGNTRGARIPSLRQRVVSTICSVLPQRQRNFRRCQRNDRVAAAHERGDRYLGVCFVDTPRDTECLHFDSFEARRDFPRSRLGRGVCLRSFASTTVGRDNWPCTLADGEVGSLIRSAEESSRCPVVGQFISHRPALLPNRSGNCFLEQWPNYRFILSTLSSVFRRFKVSSFPRRNQVSPETKKKSRDTTRHKYSPDERNFKHSTLGIISIRVEQSLRRLENQLQFPRLNKRCGAGYTYVVAF